MKRTLEIAGQLPQTVEDLPVDKKLEMAEMLQHVALVQLLLLNGGSHIIKDIDEGALEMHLSMKFGIRGLGDGKMQIFLVTKDLGGVPPLPEKE